MTLNEAYQQYKDNPSELNKEVFGKELLKYFAALAAQAGRYNDEDIIMEACLSLWKALPKYKPIYPFATWARIFYTRRKVDSIRNTKGPNSGGDELLNTDIIDYNSQRREDIESAHKQVANLLTRQDLTKNDKLLIQLKLQVLDKKYDFEGVDACGDKAMAKEMGISINTLKKRWERLRRKVQRPQ